MAKRRYRVTAQTSTLETEPGEIVELDNKRLAAELVANGALEPVKASEVREEKKDADTEQRRAEVPSSPNNDRS